MQEFRIGIAIFLTCGCLGPLTAREWQDATGKFRIEAELIEAVGDDSIKLKTEDGRTIKVRLDRLRASDRLYARRQLANRRAAKPDGADGGRDARLARLKQATALIDVKGHGTGSGFCIRSDGYFVTNYHVVSRAVSWKAPIEIVLNAGEEGERVVVGKVLSHDKEHDLALLHATNVQDWPALPLGTNEGLIETAGITAIGFPLGKLLSFGAAYPNVSITTGKVTALRKVKGQLEKIQIDAEVNPGNSGGPLLNERGEVIGVIVSKIRGTSINFAIPMVHVRSFLSKPRINVNIPDIPFSKRFQPVELQIDVLRFFDEKTKPPVVEVLRVQGGQEQRVVARRKGEGYVASVPLLSPSQGSGKTRSLLAVAQRGSKFGRVEIEDQKIRVGGEALWLSELHHLYRYPSTAGAKTMGGRRLVGEISGLAGKATGKRGEVVLLQSATRIDIFAHGDQPQKVEFAVVLRQGKEHEAFPQDVRFANPPRSSVSATHFEPIVQWRLDEETGENVADSSGDSPGRITGKPARTNGVFGGALNFDGADDAVVIGNPDRLNFADKLTVSAWIRPTAVPKRSGDISNIVAHGFALNPPRSLYLRIYKIHTREPRVQYEFGAWTGGNVGTHANGGDPERDVGRWIHLAGTWDGKHWNLYRNGTIIATKADAKGPVAVHESWAIAAHGAGKQRFFQGAVDDVRIYRRALDSEELTALAQQVE